MGTMLLWLGVAGVLLTPGPTNTLLLVGGATRGFKAALPLLVAESCAYVISISVLALVIGPIAAASPAINWTLRIAAGLYLAYLAQRLWRALPVQDGTPQTVRLRHVFTTTLVNPKGVIFAIGFAPHVDSLVAFLAGFVAVCMATASGWIFLGAVLGRNAAQRSSARWVQRGGACVLVAFGLLLVIGPILGQ
ncbi:MAG: Lysine exporter protein [Rhodospirillales bacterium]|nr:Lysine exporter protein [Rhodospirillales bacterium]